MASPQRKLAASLDELRRVSRHGVVKSGDLSRLHRERLVQNRFLQAIIRGWYFESNGSVIDGSSTPWHAVFWKFVAAYLQSKFQSEYCLAPEPSLLYLIGSQGIPRQISVLLPDYGTHKIDLPWRTSLFLYGDNKAFPREREKRDGLQLMPLAQALTRVGPAFFKVRPLDAEIALRAVRDPSELLQHLLEDERGARSGRLIGAYRFIGDFKDGRPSA